MEEISVEDVKAKRDKKEKFLFLDVRENFEYQIANIEGTKLIPLGEIESRAKELESFKDQEIIAHCHHGGRSRKALELLQSKGFTKLKNMTGGIDEWSLNVDPPPPIRGPARDGPPLKCPWRS